MLIGILALVLAAQGGTAAAPPVSAVSRPVVPQSHADATVLGTIGAEDANEIEVATLAKAKDEQRRCQVLRHAPAARPPAIADQRHQSREAPWYHPGSCRRIPRWRHGPMPRRMKELNVLSGAAFDKAFMQYEADGHKAAVAKDSVLIAQATRAAVKGFVRSLLPIHATHQDIAAKWLAAHP